MSNMSELDAEVRSMSARERLQCADNLRSAADSLAYSVIVLAGASPLLTEDARVILGGEYHRLTGRGF